MEHKTWDTGPVQPIQKEATLCHLAQLWNGSSHGLSEQHSWCCAMVIVGPAVFVSVFSIVVCVVNGPMRVHCVVISKKRLQSA